MKNSIVVVVILITAAAAGYVAHLQFSGSSAPPPPQPQPQGELTNDNIDFALPDLDGVSRKLSDWNGEARIVNFWATWCAPCRREIPLLKKLQADKENSGLQVIGIAVDFLDDVVAYGEQAEFNYPILVGEEEAMAAAEASGIDFIGLPFTLIFAPAGELVAAHMGEVKPQHVEQIIAVMKQLETGAINLDNARDALHLL